MFNFDASCSSEEESSSETMLARDWGSTEKLDYFQYSTDDFVADILAYSNPERSLEAPSKGDTLTLLPQGESLKAIPEAVKLQDEDQEMDLAVKKSLHDLFGISDEDPSFFEKFPASNITGLSQDSSSPDELLVSLLGSHSENLLEGNESSGSSNDRQTSLPFGCDNQNNLFESFENALAQLPPEVQEDLASSAISSGLVNNEDVPMIDIFDTQEDPCSTSAQVEMNIQNQSGSPSKKHSRACSDDSNGNSRSRRSTSDNELEKIRNAVSVQENFIANIAREYHQQHPVPDVVPGSPRSIEFYSKSEPEHFKEICLGQFPDQFLATFFSEYDLLYREHQYGINSDDYYGMVVALEFALKCDNLFSKLQYTQTMGTNGKTVSEERNAFFDQHRYFKGTKKCGKLYVYDNISREKLANILGLDQTVVASIELIIEEIANRLDILINGERVSRVTTQLIYLNGGKPTKETWNKKPIEVQQRLYAVVKRSLWNSFAFKGKVVELFVKKIACTVAQNNFKRLKKTKGTRKNALNINYRKNLVKGKASKSLDRMVY